MLCFITIIVFKLERAHTNLCLLNLIYSFQRRPFQNQDAVNGANERQGQGNNNNNNNNPVNPAGVPNRFVNVNIFPKNWIICRLISSKKVVK